jgi:hypothetical protein
MMFYTIPCTCITYPGGSPFGGLVEPSACYVGMLWLATMINP